jgi:hypothetical protein
VAVVAALFAAAAACGKNVEIIVSPECSVPLLLMRT